MSDYELYWPGTTILKTRHNDFNWRGKPSVITSQLDFIISNNSKKHMAGASQNGRTKSITISSGKREGKKSK